MRLVEHNHRLLERIVRTGDTVVDGTVGNGHDTLYLARRVGPGGRVIAIDLQPEAIETAFKRLSDAGLESVVHWIVGNHASLGERLHALGIGSIRCAVFNLGYLPGGNHRCITQADTTLAALDAAATRIGDGGALSVTAYCGHAGGDAEATAVEQWMARLNHCAWEVEPFVPDTRDKQPPVLWWAERRST